MSYDETGSIPYVPGYFHSALLMSKRDASTVRRGPKSGTGSELPVSRFPLLLQVLRHDLPELFAVGDVEFGAGTVDVAFDGANRDCQALSNLPVR